MDRIIKVDKGIGPIDFDERKDIPYMQCPENKDLTNPYRTDKMKGVNKSNEIYVNKSDLTQPKKRV